MFFNIVLIKNLKIMINYERLPNIKGWKYISHVESVFKSVRPCLTLYLKFDLHIYAIAEI